MAPWRCGWRPRWRGGGRSGASWRPGAAAARGRPPLRCGQRRVVRRAHLARAGVAGFGRSGRGAAPLHPVRDAIGDRGRPAAARCLSSRSATLLTMGRIAEAADDARRSWPWPGRVITRSPRRWPWRSSASSPRRRRPRRRRAAGQEAEQITAGMHGPTARVCGHTLTTVLIHAGDLAAAERVCAAGLAGARDAGDLWSLGNLLEKMVVLDLISGRYEDAAATCGKDSRPPCGPAQGKAVEDLDCCGYLCALTGRCAEAVTLWAAVVVLQGREGSRPVTPGSARGLAPAAGTPARSPAGARTGSSAGGRGTREGDEPGHRGRVRPHAHRRGPARRPRHGPGGLSPRERELVTLVARGHTDAQIAGQLYISVRTVSSHLDRIRDKTGCQRRADLTRLALSAGRSTQPGLRSLSSRAAARHAAAWAFHPGHGRAARGVNPPLPRTWRGGRTYG